jgi:hypothetical protein
MADPLARLKLKAWYHALVAISGAGIIASLTIQTKGITNGQALLIFGGGFFIGVGEWINHPLKMTVLPPDNQRGISGMETRSWLRHPQPIGSILDILGFVLIGISIYKMAF